jgi:acyl-coenzyme A thioesterase PaaI-like protein
MPTAAAPTFDPAAAGWDPDDDEGFLALVGPVWRRRSGETDHYAFVATPKHDNRDGVADGGMLMTFADRAIGRTCRYANAHKPQVTVQLGVHFVDSVKIGEFVEARCRVVRRTHTLMFASAELVVGARVVATATGVWKIMGGR